MTKQRRIIMETIRETEGHMTAEEIFLASHKKLPSLVMATVYNNLKILVEEGKIRRLQIPGQPDRYDRNMVPHEHLVCQECGRVDDAVSIDFIPDFEKRMGIHITGYNLKLYHICEECGEKSIANLG